MAAHSESPRFANSFLELGLGDEDTLEELREALRSWGAHPDSYFAYSNGEAVGWKE